MTSGVGTFSSLIGEVARKVEHILAGQFDERGYDPRLAELYSQALVGMVALVGQWWLDNRVARASRRWPRTWSTWPTTAWPTSTRDPGLRRARADA